MNVSNKKTGEEKTVLMMPDYSSGNPYQQLLAEHLESRGWTVKLSWGAGPLPLLGAIRKHGRPDVFHLHWLHPFWKDTGGMKSLFNMLRLLLELLWIRLIGVRLVWTIHNKLEHERSHPGIETFLRWGISHLCHRFIIHCERTRPILRDLYNLSRSCINKSSVIPHGHYVSVYPNNLSKREARGELSIAEDEFVYLFTGSIRPYKGLTHLIECFRNLDSGNSRLLIAGKPQNDGIEQRIRKQTRNEPRIHTVLQFIDGTDHQIYLNAADVCVFPFRDILTSGSVILAMSFGKPVIVPNIGCLPELVPGNGGIVFDPNQTDGLQTALRNITTKDLRAMGESNLRKISCFPWDEISRKTEEVYRSE